jgi:hypothetical protein
LLGAQSIPGGLVGALKGLVSALQGLIAYLQNPPMIGMWLYRSHHTTRCIAGCPQGVKGSRRLRKIKAVYDKPNLRLNSNIPPA